MAPPNLHYLATRPSFQLRNNSTSYLPTLSFHHDDERLRQLQLGRMLPRSHIGMAPEAKMAFLPTLMHDPTPT